MKTLLLLRHAKSSWKEPGQPDHERPLNKRGRRDAPRMGRLLREEDLLPDLILSSTAVRARTTAEAVAESSGYDGEIRLSAELYHAAPQSYLALLADLPETLHRVLVVGHNPGIEQLLAQLTGEDETFPTAALANVSLDMEVWPKVETGADARLIQFWLPRKLPD